MPPTSVASLSVCGDQSNNSESTLFIASQVSDVIKPVSYSDMARNSQIQRSSGPRISNRLTITGRMKSDQCYLKGHVNKRFFCVSNVHKSFSTRDLFGFIHAMGVEVLKCSATKFTGSFHVSVAARDVDIFCRAEQWPEHVTIRPWVFKKKEEEGTTLRKSPSPIVHWVHFLAQLKLLNIRNTWTTPRKIWMLLSSLLVANRKTPQMRST